MENTIGGAPQILEEARKLISRAPPFQSAELRVILDAAEHIPRDEPVSHVDSRILRAVDRLAPIFAEREPHPPTPFDDRIEEAAAEEAEKREAWEKADNEHSERALDVDSLTGSGSVMLKGRRGGPVTIGTGRGHRPGCPAPNRRDLDPARAAAQEAQEEFERADDDLKRALATLNELKHARSRWRAVAHLAVD